MEVMMMMMNMVVSLFSVLTLLFQLSHSATVMVDGVSQWRNPTVVVGDSIIFKHKYYEYYKLYIFKNKRGYDLCNFTQSTLLTTPASTSFMWRPWKAGYFYYAFNNGSLTSCNGQKLAIKVLTPPPPPPLSSALSPDLSPTSSSTPGGDIAWSTPAFSWPFRPRDHHHELSSPSLAPTRSTPLSLVPGKGGGGGEVEMPFINSNPAMPLPTGEVDSATIRPLPISSNHGGGLVVGLLGAQTAVSLVVSLMLL